MTERENIFKELEAKWPSAIVARSEVKNFSGGLLRPRTLANLDSLNQGPEGKFYVGRQVAYPVKSLIAWMQKREGGKTK